METTKKAPKVRNSRSMFIVQWWNEGTKDKTEIAKKLQEIEANGTLPQKKTDIIRDAAFYLRVANWYIVQLAKSGKIDYAVNVRKPRAPKAIKADLEATAVPTEALQSPSPVVSTSEESLIPTL